MFKPFKRHAAWLAAALCAAGTAHADVVKLVVPFAAGGPVDAVARVVGQALSTTLGDTVVIENRGGAGATIGSNYVAKAAPDGKTLLIATASYVMAAGAMPKLPYDPRKDLAPLAMLGEVQTLLVVRPSLGVKTLDELIAKGKSGQRLAYGSAGVGSTMHVGGALLNSAAGIHMVHVPYRGAAPALVDLMAGQIDVLNADVPVLQPYVKDGRLTALVIYDTKRSPYLPDVPNAVEAGQPQLQETNWYGAFAPSGTPPEVRKKLETAFLKALAMPETAKALRDAGLNGPMDAAQFQKKIDSEFDRWIPFMKANHIVITE
ncbi:tripartite tricarboxylate transporter substrate binding protein [Pigmentiphaga soli]|uniref:Tripartite tricarboxylate transporter substrate binding protein n=1 Tax=Pigmentiphaga soli TaxID=1007095 RepID=A0ABP8GXA3_9BURK